MQNFTNKTSYWLIWLTGCKKVFWRGRPRDLLATGRSGD